jgi:hypothetical protein
MLRRAALVTFAFTILLAVACGRQITPFPNLDNLAGHVVLRFRVNGTLAFSTYDYQIVIDTCGQGVPYPNPATNSYKNYSYSFNVGTSPFGVLSVYPVLIQYTLTTGLSGLTPLTVPPNPSYESFTSNDNGEGNEFELIFDRELLDNPKNLSQPCSEFTEPPATSMSTNSSKPLAATASAPAPTVAAGYAPFVQAAEAATAASPAPTSTPAPRATLPIQSTWIMNFIVLTPSGVPVDSLGPGGPTDNQFAGIIVDTTSQSDQPINKAPDSNGAPSDPNAAIAGGEVDNYP